MKYVWTVTSYRCAWRTTALVGQTGSWASLSYSCGTWLTDAAASAGAPWAAEYRQTRRVWRFCGSSPSDPAMRWPKSLSGSRRRHAQLRKADEAGRRRLFRHHICASAWWMTFPLLVSACLRREGIMGKSFCRWNSSHLAIFALFSFFTLSEETTRKLTVKADMNLMALFRYHQESSPTRSVPQTDGVRLQSMWAISEPYPYWRGPA